MIILSLIYLISVLVNFADFLFKVYGDGDDPFMDMSGKQILAFFFLPVYNSVLAVVVICKWIYRFVLFIWDVCRYIAKSLLRAVYRNGQTSSSIIWPALPDRPPFYKRWWKAFINTVKHA